MVIKLEGHEPEVEITAPDAKLITINACAPFASAGCWG